MAIVINGSGTVTGLAVGGLPDGTVDAGTLATNSVDSAELVDGAVDNSHLADDAVDSDEIAAGAIDAAHLASGVGGVLVDYKFVTVSPGAGGTSTTSTTYVEGNSSLRITHAMAASGNKLIFSFHTIDNYIASGGVAHIAVTNLTDVTTNIMSPDRPIVYIKASQGLEPFSTFGHQEYSPGSTASNTYCLSLKTGGSGTAYMNNTPAAGQMRFTLMEIKE